MDATACITGSAAVSIDLRTEPDLRGHDRLSQPPPELAPERHDPLAALRQRSFVLFTLSRVLSVTGSSLLQAALAWQVWAISDSELSLGVLGLVRFLPALGMSLIGGAAADTYNRRNIIVIAQCVPLTCAAVLAAATFGGWQRIEIIFGLVLVIGLASSFEGPARSALLPAIVRPETFANAVTVSTTLQTLGMVSGPALAGAVITVASVGAAYSVFIGLVATSLVPMLLLRYRQAAGNGRSVSFEAIREGVRFVRQRQVLLGAMSLDMFAVIFGGAQALLPVYTTDVLKVGPWGYGVLTASLELGAFLMSLVMVLRPPVVNTGRVLVYTVMAYGAATMGFGLSRVFVVSVVLYMLVGAADMVSMVMRNTTIQLATPDELRGRVSAVAQVFIGASNQLGAVESGFVAAATNATFAVVSGGAGALTVAAAIGWRLRELMAYRIAGRPIEETAVEEPARVV